MSQPKSNEKIIAQATFVHQAFQRAKPHDYHKPFEETDTEYQRVMKSIASELLAQKDAEVAVTENTSDGYHTFKELYEFRLLYNAHLFNEWAKQGIYDVHKSQRHNDGELCFGRNDYFVVVATLPTGQISNHYPISDWELFQCEAVEKAKHDWDGHTSQDVATRLRQALDDTIKALIGKK